MRRVLRQVAVAAFSACLLAAPGVDMRAAQPAVAAPSSVSYQSPVPLSDRREVEQTLLTYPEWFLVHSPAEYARMVFNQPSHTFPFLRHVGQLWSSYAAVTREQIREHYPVNAAYHLMIVVIASSTTVEYLLRSAYENSIGRSSWILGGEKLTEEDRFGARAAQDYVNFIRQEPWYLFDFGRRLRRLWTDVPIFGPGMPRKLERRYALTTEYAIKAVYGKLIEKATRATYTPAMMNTDVVVDRVPDAWKPSARIQVISRLEDGRVLLSLPRYYDFRIAATALAAQGFRIIDIAGNNTTILVSVWAKEGVEISADGSRVLFEQSLAMPASTRRVVLLVPVQNLSHFLASAENDGLSVEHVYDY